MNSDAPKSKKAETEQTFLIAITLIFTMGSMAMSVYALSESKSKEQSRRESEKQQNQRIEDAIALGRDAIKQTEMANASSKKAADSADRIARTLEFSK